MVWNLMCKSLLASFFSVCCLASSIAFGQLVVVNSVTQAGFVDANGFITNSYTQSVLGSFSDTAVSYTHLTLPTIYSV